MVRFFLFCTLIFFLSCKKTIVNEANLLENEHIETYNFKQLEPLLNRENDSTYVVNFWATWCGPCVKELPYFQELQDTYSKQNLKIILVSLDFPDKLKSQLIPFIKRKNIIPQVILLDDLDENFWIQRIDSTWSGALPATLIYNKNKRTFYKQSFTKEILFKEIEKFI